MLHATWKKTKIKSNPRANCWFVFWIRELHDLLLFRIVLRHRLLRFASTHNFQSKSMHDCAKASVFNPPLSGECWRKRFIVFAICLQSFHDSRRTNAIHIFDSVNIPLRSDRVLVHFTVRESNLYASQIAFHGHDRPAVQINKMNFFNSQILTRELHGHIQPVQLAIAVSWCVCVCVYAWNIIIINPVACVKYFRKILRWNWQRQQKFVFECNICALWHRLLSGARCGWLVPCARIQYYYYYCCVYFWICLHQHQQRWLLLLLVLTGLHFIPKSKANNKKRRNKFV